MSRENVERVKAALHAVNHEGPEAILDLLDPKVEWIADRSDLGRVTYHGHEGVLRSFAQLAEGFVDFGFDVDEVLDAGESIVAVGRMYGRGRSTGIDVEMPLGIVFTVGSNGKLVRYESFRNPTEALEAVGLRE